MKSLGKIFFIISLFSISLFGGVDASVENKNVVLGESVTLSLKISGENITEPNIGSICNSDIVSTGTQTSIQMINGSYSKSYILSYRFVPQQDCTIEPIEVSIDGKIEKSNPIAIKVGAVTQTKDANFALTLSTENKEVFIGEPFDVTLEFKQRRDADAVDSKFVAPKLNGFWIKKESEPTRTRDNDYIVTKVVYTMAAQREGELSITPAQMKIASRMNMRDFWGSFSPNVKWKTYFSNELKMKVNPLPGGVNLIGDFTLEAIADKKVMNPNEAINVVVKVKGEGNLEDIKSFKPYVNGVNVFDEKIDINGTLLNQKLAFISDDDFIIPSFTLKFYNPKTKQIQTLASQEIPIHVKGAKQKEHEPLVIKRQEEPLADESGANIGFESVINRVWLAAAFLIGLACGIVIMLLKPFQTKEKKIKLSLKNPKVLLMKLLPYKHDAEVAKIVDDLEKNIYSQSNIAVDKKVLKTVLKRYGL